MLLFLYGLQDWPRFQVCLGLWISKVEPSSQRYGPFWHQPQPLDRARPGKGTWKRSQSRSLPCLAKDRRHEQRRFHTDRQQEKVCGAGYSLLSAHLWWPLWWTWTSSGRMWPTWRDPLAQLARGECAANCTCGCLFLFWCKHDRSRSQSCFSHVFTIPTGLPTMVAMAPTTGVKKDSTKAVPTCLVITRAGFLWLPVAWTRTEDTQIGTRLDPSKKTLWKTLRPNPPSFHSPPLQYGCLHPLQ